MPKHATKLVFTLLHSVATFRTHCVSDGVRDTHLVLKTASNMLQHNVTVQVYANRRRSGLAVEYYPRTRAVTYNPHGG